MIAFRFPNTIQTETYVCTYWRILLCPMIFMFCFCKSCVHSFLHFLVQHQSPAICGSSFKELKVAFTNVFTEVPGSPIFLMKMVSKARHLEIQIVGDEYGNTLALNGRDCSTQRTWQIGSERTWGNAWIWEPRKVQVHIFESWDMWQGTMMVTFGNLNGGSWGIDKRFL